MDSNAVLLLLLLLGLSWATAEIDEAKELEALKKMNNMEFFKSAGKDDTCGTVPKDLLTGSLKAEACKGATDSAEVCVCAKFPEEALSLMRESGRDLTTLNAATGFMNECGECYNPCALHWITQREKEMMAEFVISVTHGHM